MIELQCFDNVNKWEYVAGVIQDSLSDETTLDESYDNATIRARNTKDSFNEPFTKYRVFDGVEWRYYIGSETVQRVQMSKYYLHTYRLTEPTKIIERYKLSGLSVTQPQTGTKKTLSDVIKRALKDVNIRYSKSFALSDDKRLQAVLTQECPEFSVTKKTTLFEFLYDYIGKFINAMPRLLGNANGSYNVIDFDFFEDLTKLDLSINETGLEYSKNEENASTYLETEISNLVVENADNEGSIVYPYVDGWITPRSEEIRLTSDNASMILPYDIKRILKLEIYLENYDPDVTIYDKGTLAGERTGNFVDLIDPTTDYTGYFDITGNVLTEKEWLSLGEIKTAKWETTEIYKNNTLYYSVGSNAIQNLSKTYKSTIFSDSYVLSYLIASVFYNQYKGKIIKILAVSDGSQGTLKEYEGELKSVVIQNFNPKDLKYRVTYIPYIDTVTAQINANGIEKGSLTYNQSAETVNSQSLGESMWLELQNQNTTMYQKTARYDNVSDILKVGDIIDNKIITNVSRAFTGSKWINVLYKSNEDFIRKSQYIQENREYRPYSIPATTIVDRHIHTDDYCYVGYSNISEGIAFRNDFINAFIEKKNEISNVSVDTDTDNLYCLTASSIALGHSIQFDWSMVDNFSAGKYIVNPNESTPTIKEVAYVFPDGTFNKITISLNPTYNGTLSSNYLPYAKNDSNSNLTLDTAYYTRYYPLDKDAGEKISGSIQLHFLPAENDVIVSSNLAKDCPLIGDKNYNFTLAFTNENINKYSNSLKEYYKPVSITKELDTTSDDYGNEQSAVKITPNSIPQDYTYWALIDANTNSLYCAGLTKNIKDSIYLSFVASEGEKIPTAKILYQLIEGADGTYYSVIGAEYEVGAKPIVNIPSKYKNLQVKEISTNAFNNDKIIQKVIIPPSIEKIYAPSFENCENLYEVEYNAISCVKSPTGISLFSGAGLGEKGLTIIIGETVNEISSYMFAESNVQKLNVNGKALESIGGSAFFNCQRLTEITIPENITKIGQTAFGFCENLQTVTYNAKNCQGFSSNEGYPFKNSGNNLTVKIGNDAKTIPAYMFANSKIKTLEATGNSLLSINEGAFYSCYDLSSITLSDTITSIGNDAFSYCAFTSVTIPKNIQSIGKYAFTSVSSVYYYGNNVYNLIKGIYEDSNVRFANDVTIYANIMNDSGYPQVFSDKTLIIPYSPDYTSIDWNGTTDIKRIIIDPRINNDDYTDSKIPVKSGAFAGFPNLKEVWIPKSMKSRNDEGTKLISLIEEGAFTPVYGLTGIEKVYFEGDRDEWEIVSRKYWSDQYETYVYGIGIPYSATIKYNQPMYKYENK